MDHLNIRLDDTFRPKLHGRALYDPRRHRFHSFLKEMGWKLDNDFVPLIDKDRSQITADLNQILQSWLFFGLLATVIQRPAKKVLDLNVFIANGLITTRELSKYLKEWADREISDKAGQTMRMIQVQLALDKARKVVRKCCSVEEGNRQPGNAPTNATIDGKLMLSLMVIGETLSNAKIRIVEQVGTNVRGWHGDANEGWGTPQFLLDRMVDRNWCKRTVHSLKGQLRSNATALLYAYQEHDEKHFKGHQNCTDDECVVKSVDSEGSYDPEHQPACKNKGCPLIGPDMDEIISRIGRGIVPMLEYKSHEHKVEVKVSDHKPHMRYATVSHVWADGYGNPKENRLWKCQLDFFDSLFRKAQSDNDHHHGFRFWIDTLAIPVGNTDTHRQHRKNAIRKINDIFTKATYTIVIDNGLTSMGAGIDYQAAAMRILASRWMRRLWTLQEAYLSRRLLFTFEGPFLKDLDQLEEDYQYALANNELTSNIPSAARAYFHNLLGADRKARINDFPDANGFGLLANVWRAAQWRTTSHPEHETLALATLLNVDYEETSFSRAGLLPESANGTSATTSETREEMMKDLWRLIHETCPGSIPPGMIFLPGPRLSIKGFGWAPKTWMSSKEVDFPDPLATMSRPASLEDRGLLVQYPGFLLHGMKTSAILYPLRDFYFAIDNTLLEWYTVRFTDEILSIEPQDDKDLAIILCRQRPGEVPEIALLVQIEKRIVQKNPGGQRHSTIFQSLIVCRVTIKRDITKNAIEDPEAFLAHALDKEETTMCGEILDDDQKWYVDGRCRTT